MRALLVVAVLTAAASSSAFGIVDDKGGAAGFEVARGASVDALPLRSQTTTVDVAGVIARIRIEQVWQNAGRTPIEAVYVFPTSTRAALHDLRLRINDQRELRAEIRAKEQAQKIYEAARDNGQTAGLLEQQRPNAVTMNVANILPGDKIVVVIEASELLRSVEGVYELVLPQTIGTRYQGNAGSESFVENGSIAASSSTVQTKIEVTVRSPIGVKRIGSPSHGIAPLFDGADEAKVVLTSSVDDVIADRDVVLRWQLAGDDNETGVLLFRDKDSKENFFLLLGEAPADVEAVDAPAREVVFVVDVSGSMGGFPLDTAKGLLRDLVGELRDEDRFNMLFFAGSSTVLAEHSLAPTPNNIALALNTLNRHQGGGGTELREALQRALALPVDKDAGRARVVVVVTDGFVSAERAVFDDVRDHLGDASVFAFGIGSSVNRDLIEGLARAGHTEPFVMLDAAQGLRAVDHFRVNVGRPSLTHINVRFDGFTATDLEPARAPDLFPGRPLVMLGKFSGPSSGNVVVTGTGLRGAPYEHVIPIEDNLERKEHAPLASLWARSRIARLADGNTPSTEQLAEVEQLGLRYRLLSERTSFVVVDPAVRNANGDAAAVAQPSVTPRGVKGDTVTQSVSGSFFGVGVGALGGLSGSSGLVGSGGLGTRGLGTGGGIVGLGTGSGRSKGGTRVVPGQIIYEGGLSREEIQRVISRSMSQIKYCYEKQLVAVPGLKGKLVLRWQISSDGTVTNAVTAQNDLGTAGNGANEVVGACVQRIISRLQFPAPKGGGKVNVTYPFVFSATE